VPTMQQSIVPIQFYLSDAPAAPGGAQLPPIGLPDVVDVGGVLMPFTGTIVGCVVQCKNAAGDTVTALPQVSNTALMGSPVAANSLSTPVTNAVQNNSTLVSKDQADAQFTSGQYVGVKYTTTTGGTYTVFDLLVTLYISTGRTDL